MYNWYYQLYSLVIEMLTYLLLAIILYSVLTVSSKIIFNTLDKFAHKQWSKLLILLFLLIIVFVLMMKMMVDAIMIFRFGDPDRVK